MIALALFDVVRIDLELRTHTPYDFQWPSKGQFSNNRCLLTTGLAHEQSAEDPTVPRFPRDSIFYSFVTPWMALEGQTPAEAAGLQIDSRNKWLALIQNAKNADNESK